jgi:hypothetical protein
MTDYGARFMNPFNHGVEPPYPVPAETYLEVLISPLRFARAWSMDAGANMDQMLKASRKGPLTNPDGDKIEIEEKEGITTLKLVGKIVHDAKTKVNIEATWQILDRGKIGDAQLDKSLLRSF